MVARDLITLQQASDWASAFSGRMVSISNISYLVNYGKLKKYGENGSSNISKSDLQEYYSTFKAQREIKWKQKLGQDLNWSLSFDHLREKDTTKHVHRLHPYKGKYIPQLVEYFLDSHTDEYKRETFFNPCDVVLDPFSGSGTTLVQANEMGIHSIGIDVSQFNSMIAETKLSNFDLIQLQNESIRVAIALNSYAISSSLQNFESELNQLLGAFNQQYFPSPEFKRRVYRGEINENKYAQVKATEFLSIYRFLIKKYQIKLSQENRSSFLDQWYLVSVREQIEYTLAQINNIRDKKIRQIMLVILSRTVRSCRATTHSDLATLKSPQIETYYCFKHKKICKPLFSIKSWFDRYTKDSISRISQFQQFKSKAFWSVITADSRSVDILEQLRKANHNLYQIVKTSKINGIFTSPPYVGQIDYHEQHAYAYDLFGLDRKDELEIGPLYKGKGLEARQSYVDGISLVLRNCSNYLTDDYNVFLVANDKWGLYQEIARRSGMKIVNQYKRPVLNRTERDKNPYSETIFHCKKV